MTVVRVPLQDLGKWEKAIGKGKLRSTFRTAMKTASAPMLSVARSNTASALPASPGGKSGVYYKGRFFKSWRAVVNGIALSLTLKNTSHHAAFVEFGRRAGAAMPPLRPIMDWVRAKLGARGFIRPLARAIALAISRRGLRGRFILVRSHLELTSIFVKHVTDAYAQMMS